MIYKINLALLFSYGKIKFKMIPVMAERAVPERVTGPSLRIAPPSPSTNIALAMIRLRI